MLLQKNLTDPKRWMMYSNWKSEEKYDWVNIVDYKYDMINIVFKSWKLQNIQINTAVQKFGISKILVRCFLKKILLLIKAVIKNTEKKKILIILLCKILL